mmetsp:Transcript_23326/g.57898  ORF Transcript_23326/g.57898 Transcript_23326/m.57898 type:complete len:359 (-) Transcript_23326:372-1448(-)
MGSRRVLQRGQVPSAQVLHRVAERIDVDVRASRRAEGYDTHVRPADELDPVDLLDRLADRLCGADDLPRRLDIPAEPMRSERRPRRGDDAAWPAAEDGGRGVDAARPLGDESVHRVAQLRRREHHDRGSLWREAILVRVARDAGHAAHAEVAFARQVEARLLHEGQQEAAEAAVDVQPAASRSGDAREAFDRIDCAVGELRRRADDGDGVRVDEPAHVVEVDLHGGVDARVAQLDAEVLRRLVEGGVCSDARHDVGRTDAALLAAVVAVRLHRHEDRLGAARRERADGVGASVVQVDHHLNDLRLHLPRRRVDRHVQRVGEGKHPVDLPDEVHVLLLPVVHGAGHHPVLPVLGIDLSP